MNDRWYIYRDGQALGPLTSSEIREGLRDGTFDPFDLVARDGSSVRRELVEVDEIFSSSKIEYAADGDGRASGQGGLTGEPPDLPRSPENPRVVSGFVPLGLADGGAGKGDATQVSSRQEPRGPGFALANLKAELAAAEPPRNRGRGSKRRDAKRYQLVDAKGRVLGPLSASEIQSLFFKGVIEKSVNVIRQGSQAKVPVAKFVSVYGDASSRSRGMQQGAHPQMGDFGSGKFGGAQGRFAPPGPVQAIPRQPLSMIAIVGFLVALVLTSAAGYIAFKHGGFLAHDRGAVHERKSKKAAPKATPKSSWSGKLARPKAKADKGKTGERDQGRADRRDSARTEGLLQQLQDEQLADQRRRESVGNKQRKDEFAREQREKQKRLLEQARREHLQETRPRPDRRKTTTASLAVTPGPTTKKRTTPAPAAVPKAPAPKAAKTPAPAAAAGAPTVATLATGQTVSRLGPMSFDRGALESCQASCSIAFSGAGGTVQVNFVKAAWGPTLSSKSGGVYISGLVRKSGATTKVILQDVQ